MRPVPNTSELTRLADTVLIIGAAVGLDRAAVADAMDLAHVFSGDDVERDRVIRAGHHRGDAAVMAARAYALVMDTYYITESSHDHMLAHVRGDEPLS